jgi:hypothetical protein
MLNSDQTPQYSDIRRAGHEGGEFIFVPINKSPKLEKPHETKAAIHVKPFSDLRVSVFHLLRLNKT